MPSSQKTYLIILDGFGIGDHGAGDAIFHAHTPYIDSLFSQYPTTRLKTDGMCVGLPEFQTGGSEVGHITIGAGRQIKHLLTKINDQIESGDFFTNPTLIHLFEKAKKNNRIHLMGLASDGGIHSFLPHVFGLQTMAKQMGIDNVFLHPFLDGRDVGERTAQEYIQSLENKNIGKIASIMGRFYSMDRDANWDRVQKAYDTLCSSGENASSESWQEVLEAYYNTTHTSDYYMPPTLLDREGQIRSDDIVLCYNYRTDRMRQLSTALCDADFTEFERNVVFQKENYGIFGPYCDGGQEPFSFADDDIRNTLGEVLSQAGKTQVRISETEKFNHVTFFFSGERKQEFIGETRILIPSKKCASYAEKPEMSAPEQTDAALEAITKTHPDFVVQNFANADLVGHSGDFQAAKQSIEVLDACLKRLIPICQKEGYEVFITADHGNSDEMYFPNGDRNASHTKNLVPFCHVSSQKGGILKDSGDLGDIAPTILEAMGIAIPPEMTGESLHIRND